MANYGGTYNFPLVDFSPLADIPTEIGAARISRARESLANLDTSTPEGLDKAASRLLSAGDIEGAKSLYSLSTARRGVEQRKADQQWWNENILPGAIRSLQPSAPAAPSDTGPAPLPPAPTMPSAPLSPTLPWPGTSDAAPPPAAAPVQVAAATPPLTPQQRYPEINMAPNPPRGPNETPAGFPPTPGIGIRGQINIPQVTPQEAQIGEALAPAPVAPAAAPTPQLAGPIPTPDTTPATPGFNPLFSTTPALTAQGQMARPAPPSAMQPPSRSAAQAVQEDAQQRADVQRAGQEYLYYAAQPGTPPAAKDLYKTRYDDALSRLKGITNDQKEFKLDEAQRLIDGRPTISYNFWKYMNDTNKERFSELQKYYGTVQDAGDSARSTRSTIGVMRNIVSSPDFVSGRSSDLFDYGVSLMQSLTDQAKIVGVDPKYLPKVDEMRAMNSIQLRDAFNALSSKLILATLGGKLGVGTSENDRRFVERASPGLLRTPGGNQQLLNIYDAMAAQQEGAANVALTYRNTMERRGQIPDPVEMRKLVNDYTDSHPVLTDKFGKNTSLGDSIEAGLKGTKSVPDVIKEPLGNIVGAPPTTRGVIQGTLSAGEIPGIGPLVGAGRRLDAAVGSAIQSGAQRIGSAIRGATEPGSEVGSAIMGQSPQDSQLLRDIGAPTGSRIEGKTGNRAVVLPDGRRLPISE